MDQRFAGPIHFLERRISPEGVIESREDFEARRRASVNVQFQSGPQAAIAPESKPVRYLARLLARFGKLARFLAGWKV
jgi:hypothetical protein